MATRHTLRSLVGHIRTGNWLERAIVNYDSSFDESEKWVAPNINIHPSGSASKCVRFIQLGMLGHRFAQTLSRRRMDNGTKIHEVWNVIFGNMDLLYSCDVPLQLTGQSLHIGETTYESVFWRGIVDVVLRHPKTGKLHIGELKSMNSTRWEKIPDQLVSYEETTKALELVEDKYVGQLCQYYTMFSRFSDIADSLSDECFFLFENTDTQEIKIRWLKFTEDKQKNVLDLPVLAQYNLLNGDLLDAPFERDSSICASCSRKTVCFEIADGIRSIDIKKF